ncbi:MAG: DUF1049 domain-containing protein [Gammaproteobacteria bacterium]|nr:DUF1049 domain-containing protein [Gammaproteobacteria bacterium]
MRKILNYLFAVFVLIIGIILAIYNSNSVEINLVVFQAQLPLALLIIITLIIGALLGIVTSFSLMYKSRREVQKLKKQYQLNQKEINNLRTIPFKD